MDESCKRRVYQNYIRAMNTRGKSKVGTVENQLNKKKDKLKGARVALPKKKKMKKTNKKADKKSGRKTKKKTGKKIELDSGQNDTMAAAAAADDNGDRPAATETPLIDPCPKKVCVTDDTVIESTPCKGVTLRRDSMKNLGRRHVRTAGEENGNCRRRVCDNGAMTAEGNY